MIKCRTADHSDIEFCICINTYGFEMIIAQGNGGALTHLAEMDQSKQLVAFVLNEFAFLMWKVTQSRA